MSTPSLILFSIALVFYLLTWKYIRQLVREVNEVNIRDKHHSLQGYGTVDKRRAACSVA